MDRDGEIAAGMKACRRGIWTTALFSVALNVLMLTVPFYMIAIYDRVLASGSTETLLMLTIVAAGALLVIGVLEVVRQVILTRLGARLESTLGGPLLRASLQVDGGRPDAQALRDLAQVRQFMSSPFFAVLFDAPIAPLYVLLIFLVHPHLGWITLAMAVLLLAVSVLNQQLTRTELDTASLHSRRALQQAQSQMRNAEAVRVMGMLGNAVEAWGRENSRALNASDSAAQRSAFLTGASRSLRLFVQIAILGYGAYLVLTDANLNAGIIFAASIISARALAPVDQAVGGWRSFVSAFRSWQRIKALLAAAPVSQRTRLPEPQASLSAEKLIYAPASAAEPIIKGVSFAIDVGETVGIIGPSGAGKSTLARLLVGALPPASGVVRIGGDDITNWTDDDLGPFIGYVPQDVELFSTTVAQNIARLQPSPDSGAVIAAAKLANCHELIQKLPKGYDTPIGPQGHTLSGGQRQRIALARAFFGSPKIVVLDEPNASLDSEGEQALIAALLAARAAGITCIVITQRTSLLPALTKLMVLRDGQIEIFGPKDQVLQGAGPQPVPSTGGAQVGARFG